MEYTYENWLKVNEVLKLTNKQISEITGTSESNIRKQLLPSKKLPTWIRTLMYGYYHGTKMMLPLSPFEKEEDVSCGCYLNAKKLYIKVGDCPLSKSEHKHLK